MITGRTSLPGPHLLLQDPQVAAILRAVAR